MAVNKRKVLDAARKYAQKGAKDKALKEYHTLVKLDPRDAKLHLEIGDCYRRWGQVEEAATQYSRVADQYKDDGFDARAVAVFKQILNLDPKRYSAYVSLSELYQRMGLDSEALVALQQAADGYHKEGNKRDALELLRRMATLDPTNTTSRLKVAELLRQEGMEDDAVAEYDAVVAELGRQGATETVVAVQERILELQPGRVDVLVGMGRRLVELGQAGRAEPLAKKALEKDPEEAEAYEILIEVYRSLEKEEALAQTTRTLAKIYRDRGDDDRARELTQRIPLALELEASDGPGLSADTDSAFLGDDDLLDEDFLDTEEDTEADDPSEELVLDGGEELELEFDDDPPAAAPEPDPEPEADAADDALPEGEPDQLLAEASVYLRYGKRDQAIASLKAILMQEPDHRGALEKLGEAHAEGDDGARAVECWTLAAQAAQAEGDSEGFAVLRDRIAGLDAEAAAALGDAEPASVLDDEPALDVGVEMDLDVGGDDAGFEIDVSVGDDEAEPQEEAPGADLGLGEIELDTGEASPDAEPELDAGEGIDIDVDVDLDGDDDEGDGKDAADEEVGASTTTSQQVSEDLEEADFYFQQGLYDEAEGIYRRILEVAPNHPSAMLRMGEIEAARAGDAPAGAESDPDLGGPDLDLGGPDLDLDGPDLDLSGPDLDDSPPEDSTEVAELTADETETEPAVQMDVPPVSRADITTPFDSFGEDAVLGSEPPAASDGGGFDLAAELRNVIEDDPNAASDSSLSTVEDGFESIFADFKQGVSATLSEDDYETRYDLGIAYREMELYDDAIGEFRMCLESPTRRLESLHLMGLCALDLGRAEDAANHLEQALATPDLPREQVAGLQFDLGRAFEAAGDTERARSAYQASLAADADFPGAAERLAGLGEGGGAGTVTPDDEDGAFESFDDLVAEASADDAGPEPSEAFESFDDVLSDAEEAQESAHDDDAAAEAEPDEPGKSPARKKFGKKKISFV